MVKAQYLYLNERKSLAMRSRLWVLTIVFTAVGALGSISAQKKTPFLIWNKTPSAPQGLYLKNPSAV